MAPRRSIRGKGKKDVREDTSKGPTSKVVRKKGPLVRMPTSKKNFQNKSQEVHFKRVTRFRNVISGTIVKFEDLEGLPVLKWLEDVGLDTLCTMNEKIYPDLVKYFYSNWVEKITARGLVVTTFVKGITISISESTIREALGVGDIMEGEEHTYARFCNMKSNTVVGEWQYSRCFPLFCKNKKVGSLNPYIRILHKIVVTCLFPRSGCETELFCKDACILWYILKKRKIDMAHVIFESMRNIARSGGRKALSYDMIITRLLRQNLISFDDEVVDNDMFFIDRLRLKFMGFVFHDGKWTTDGIPAVPLDCFPLVHGGEEPINVDEPLLGADAVYDDVDNVDEETESDNEAAMPEHERVDAPINSQTPQSDSNRPVTMADLEALKEHFTQQIQQLRDILLMTMSKNG